MRLPLVQVDAFTDRPFAGNPAAVVRLDAWLPDALLQAVAAEQNLPETAFLVAEGEGWRIRWFTPEYEMDLCGHATLAAAFVLLEGAPPGCDRVGFLSRSGPLSVTREEDLLWLDLPARPPAELPPPKGLAEALGAPVCWTGQSRDLLVLLGSEEEVRGLKPDFAALARLDTCGVLATAPGDAVDFVSRCFFPKEAMPEDPVTGSAHCTLVPFWAAHLGRTRLLARQLSPRGGELRCEAAGPRVRLGGRAVKVLEGTLLLPD